MMSPELPKSDQTNVRSFHVSVRAPSSFRLIDSSLVWIVIPGGVSSNPTATAQPRGLRRVRQSA